jgi:hypothetical protein
MKWEGEAPAEPKRQQMASSEWRIVFSEGQCSRTAENFGALGDAPLQNFSPNKFGAQENPSSTTG